LSTPVLAGEGVRLQTGGRALDLDAVVAGVVDEVVFDEGVEHDAARFRTDCDACLVGESVACAGGVLSVSRGTVAVSTAACA
jgi:hypothetical protein